MKKLTLCLAALVAALLFAGSTALAAESHEGRVVKAGGGKLTMTDKDGKNEHSHEVASDAVITLDGKDCKLDDVPKDSWVKVTTENRGDKSFATKIEAKKDKDK